MQICPPRPVRIHLSGATSLVSVTGEDEGGSSPEEILSFHLGWLVWVYKGEKSEWVPRGQTPVLHAALTLHTAQRQTFPKSIHRVVVTAYTECPPCAEPWIVLFIHIISLGPKPPFEGGD